MIQVARGNRKDMIQRITNEIKGRLEDVGIKARVLDRKNIFMPFIKK